MAVKFIKQYTNEDGDELAELFEENGTYRLTFYGYQLGPSQVTLAPDTDADALAAKIIANRPARKSLRQSSMQELIANAERVTGLKVF